MFDFVAEDESILLIRGLSLYTGHKAEASSYTEEIIIYSYITVENFRLYRNGFMLKYI